MNDPGPYGPNGPGPYRPMVHEKANKVFGESFTNY